MNRIPRLTRFLTLTLLFYVVAFSAARLGFWLLHDNPNDPLGSADLLQALYIGLKFDLRLSLLIILPVLLLGWLKPLNPLTTTFGRRLWLAYLLLATLGVVLFYVTDFGHYAYLHVRVDSTVLRFLSNPLISLEMVWQSYPVIPWLIVLALLLTGITLAFRHVLRIQAETRHQPLHGWRKGLMVSATLLLVLFGIYGKISWYPLRWSDAFFSNHAFASTLTFNPVLYFYDTYKNGGMPYDEEAVKQYYPQIADYLGVDHSDPAVLNFARQVAPANRPTKAYNVVVVILESFAAYKSGLSGNPLQPTPNFDEVASNGLYFRNFYTPTTGTARSMFCAITGIPDVQLGDTSSRNPTIVNQHVIMDEFEGYEKFYFLGGSASWRNIRAMLANNIPGLHIYEEGSYQSPRIDVWGISDLDLFKEAHKVLKDQKKPFFAVIQTSGNHRPYTIPENNEGFELRDASAEDLAKYGFESVEEFNSYRFMDHSIGHFMQQVKDAGYFDNTVFAFFGDHGISGNAGVHTHKGDTQLGLGSNRVPFVIYAPSLIPEGKVMDTVASETDVMTTLASFTGHPHINTTLGRDLLNPRFDQDRHAFIIAHAANTMIGVVNQDYYFRMPLSGGEGTLHRIASEEPRENVSAQHPALAEQMKTLTRGLYESARYITNNNPRLEGKTPVLSQASNQQKAD